MIKNTIIFFLGAIAALISYFYVVKDETSIGAQKTVSDRKSVEEKNQKKIPNIDDAIESKLKLESVPPTDKSSESVKYSLQGHQSEISIEGANKELVDKIYEKLDYQSAYENEEIDALKKQQAESHIYTLFGLEKAIELNLGLQSLTCKSERCKLEIFPVNGDSQLFSDSDVVAFFSENKWFDGQEIHFNTPDKNGIRTLYVGPDTFSSLDIDKLLDEKGEL